MFSVEMDQGNPSHCYLVLKEIFNILPHEGISFIVKGKASGLLGLDTLDWTKARSKVTRPMVDGPELCGLYVRETGWFLDFTSSNIKQIIS